MGVYNGAPHLAETIESVLSQTLREFEFLIVNDGSTDTRVASIIADYEASDSRLKVLRKQNEGITVALVEGCRAASGAYIARIDVGDVMAPNRLAEQKKVLDEHPGCHLVTSAVSFHGPAWEALWVNQGRPGGAIPVNVVSTVDGEGLEADIPHHGSVMFRKAAYEQVGGYRPEFYYGQDWDLWYRLAETGSLFVVPQVLYRARFFPDAISMGHSQRQKRIAEISLAAHQLRKKGLSDQSMLAQAKQIRQGLGDTPSHRQKATSGNYFIGEALRRNGNPRCRAYLAEAIKACPWSLKSWLRLAQSMTVARH